jgi:hypothetical protein
MRLVGRGRFRPSLRFFGPHKSQVDPKSCMPLISAFYGDIQSGSFSAFASKDAVVRHPARSQR